MAMTQRLAAQQAALSQRVAARFAALGRGRSVGAASSSSSSSSSSTAGTGILNGGLAAGGAGSLRGLHGASSALLTPSLVRANTRSGVSPPQLSLRQLAQRALSSALRPPEEMSPEKLLGIAETVLMYLEGGRAGADLDALRQDESMQVTGKLRQTLGVYVATQLHVIAPFGFEASQAGLEQFAQAQVTMLQQAQQEQRLDDAVMQELARLNRETWQVMLSRAFGIEELPELDQAQLRSATSQVSGALQDPAFLKGLAEAYESELRPMVDAGKLEEAHDKLQAMLVPAFVKVVDGMKGVKGLPEGDLGFIVLQTCINQNMGDPVIRQNMAAGQMAVYGAAPLTNGAPPT